MFLLKKKVFEPYLPLFLPSWFGALVVDYDDQRDEAFNRTNWLNKAICGEAEVEIPVLV